MEKVNNPSAAQVKGTINLRCPHCRHNGAFSSFPEVKDAIWTVNQRRHASGAVTADIVSVGVRVCPNQDCHRHVFVELRSGKLSRSYPPEVIDFDASNLPANILESLEEAVKAHAAGCYRASALMVRRVLEELCQHQTAAGSNLKERIASLGQTIIIPPALMAAADELRLLGNDAAHIEAKTYDAIEKEEIDIAIELTKELLKATYQYGGLVARMQALKK
jgi:hypothetical protein